MPPVPRPQYLRIRRLLPLAVWVACVVFCLIALISPIMYPSEQEELLGYEYRCGEQFDRASCADVPVYATHPVDRFGLSLGFIEYIANHRHLSFFAIVIGFTAFLLWLQWSRDFKNHLHTRRGG